MSIMHVYNTYIHHEPWAPKACPCSWSIMGSCCRAKTMRNHSVAVLSGQDDFTNHHFNGKITILMNGKITILMGKSPFLIGKSPFLMGKS